MEGTLRFARDLFTPHINDLLTRSKINSELFIFGKEQGTYLCRALVGKLSVSSHAHPTRPRPRSSQARPKSARLNRKDVQNGQLSSPAQPRRAETRLVPGKAAGESKLEAYPLGYVEDFDEPRTTLEVVFNIRQSCEIFGSEYPIAGEIFDCAYRL